MIDIEIGQSFLPAFQLTETAHLERQMVTTGVPRIEHRVEVILVLGETKDHPARVTTLGT
ncbi:hypothetical protein GCM10022402_14230 [Salinactinospora qingdaonensis]|uniref:Uncharacterized protein n=1 Tax=Salinactinospora qingdaonensis TaxID=702744 RepID=A0ABP7FAT6_9ACTN